MHGSSYESFPFTSLFKQTSGDLLLLIFSQWCSSGLFGSNKTPRQWVKDARRCEATWCSHLQW